ncbi:hypothetical protein BSR29_04730 [Boudabousia liubingyangii]|uniref:Metallo-beta-lactamase domain-containing protein n=1 Tax=Boudabousia liubingyangii TaxID=1921764 RepID=A0A1Q5PNX8_9ACTO|nr:MBL fold metallo-hydrolase [Boudabousia liubingyangii]OKL47714.1 hypothetical protein BSR28_04295 [Boudabousia liubingyangii]OKL49140.1 hypothetical protein BSR29_04730 [Boudabousia liubingyangii]
MRIERITAPLFAANAYLISHEGKGVVIDPGAGTAEKIKATAQANGVELVASLATHGHADHIWDAGNLEIPLYISEPDAYRLEDPIKTTAGSVLPMQSAIAPYLPWNPPKEVRIYEPETFTSATTPAPGISFRGLPTPGHSEGSIILLLAGAPSENLEFAQGDPTFARPLKSEDQLVFTGDLIFAGSVGRQDLPGGDVKEMRHSLRTFANVIDPRSVLLPGHGPLTTLEREIETNSYLRQARKIG